MTAAQWEVGSPPPPPSPTDQPGDMPPPNDAPIGPQLPAGWTEDDIRSLIEIVRGPYDKLAELASDDAYRLSKVDELLLVATLTTWIPVAWVRAGAHGQLPLIVALPLTAVVVGAVSLPKLVHWNRANPDAAIAIPFIFPKGARRAADRPRPTPSDAGNGSGRVEPHGGPGDHGEVAADAAVESSPVVSGDGGPPADSLDSIRRGYSARG